MMISFIFSTPTFYCCWCNTIFPCARQTPYLAPSTVHLNWMVGTTLHPLTSFTHTKISSTWYLLIGPTKRWFSVHKHLLAPRRVKPSATCNQENPMLTWSRSFFLFPMILYAERNSFLASAGAHFQARVLHIEVKWRHRLPFNREHHSIWLAHSTRGTFGGWN